MGHHAISIAVLLLSLTAGTLLLAKTNKDGLGMYYRVVSWFVMVFSMLLILCSVVRCIAGREHHKKNHERHGNMMWRGGMGGMYRGGMHRDGIGMGEMRMEEMRMGEREGMEAEGESMSSGEGHFMKGRHHRGEGKDSLSTK